MLTDEVFLEAWGFFWLNIDRLVYVDAQAIEKHNTKFAIITGGSGGIGPELDD